MSRARVLVAPDSFKGTFDATEIADAIGEGVASAGVEPDLCPAADGGEGTMDVLLRAFGGELKTAMVADPLGDAVTARFALLERDGMAVVETAEASGLRRVTPSPEVALAASSYGTGELIAAALDAGADRVLVGVGGSATSDGGRGAITALEDYGKVESEMLDVICDVQTSFEHAAPLFAPQKGATPEVVRELSARLDQFAGELRKDPRGVAMTGCGGGLAGGLWARYDALLQPGASFVLDALGFNRRLAGAAAVVSGEGKLDRQTTQGKLVSEVCRRAGRLGYLVHALVGRCDLDDEGIAELNLASVVETPTLAAVRTASHRLGKRIRGGSSDSAPRLGPEISSRRPGSRSPNSG